MYNTYMILLLKLTIIFIKLIWNICKLFFCATVNRVIKVLEFGIKNGFRNAPCNVSKKMTTRLQKGRKLRIYLNNWMVSSMTVYFECNSLHILNCTLFPHFWRFAIPKMVLHLDVNTIWWKLCHLMWPCYWLFQVHMIVHFFKYPPPTTVKIMEQLWSTNNPAYIQNLKSKIN